MQINTVIVEISLESAVEYSLNCVNTCHYDWFKEAEQSKVSPENQTENDGRKED